MSLQRLESVQSFIKPLSAWKISGIVYREVFLDGSIATSGPQLDRMKERIRDNKNYLQTSAITMKIVTAVFVLALYFLIIVGIFEVGLGDIENSIFSLSSAISMVFVFQLMFVFAYGLIGLIGFFGSSAFLLLHTLPIPKRKVQIVSYLTFFRLMNWQILSIFIGLPITVGSVIGLITSSWIKIVYSVLISSVMSFVNIIFLLSIMISVSLYISKKIFKPSSGSKIKTFLQIIVTLSYTVVVLGASLAVTLLVDVIKQGFQIGPNGLLINSLVNFIVYPFGLSYLQAVCIIGPIIGWYFVPLHSILISIAGFLLTCGITYFIFRKSLGILSSLSKQEVYESKQQSPSNVIISIDSMSPVQAIYKKDMQYIFRNFTSTMFFIFPILMPVVLLVSVLGIEIGGFESFFQTSVFAFFYSGMTLSFSIMCVTSPESETGGLLYILPAKMWDIFRVKRRIMYFSMALSALAPSIINIVFALIGKYTGSENFLIPSLIIAVSYYVIYFYGTEISLILYSRFFGKMRNKYTIQMLNVKHKIGKIVLGIILIYIICFSPLIAGIFIGIGFGMSTLYGSLGVLGIAIILLFIIHMLAIKNFNSH